MRKLKSVAIQALCVLAIVAAQPASVAASGAEFAAQTRHIGPQGVMGTGRIFVSDGRVRTEMSQGGHRVVQILDQASGRGYTLDPERKVYMEQSMGPGGSGPGATPGSALPDLVKHPCAGVTGQACHALGREELAGRSVVKREIDTRDPRGKPLKLTQWIDPARGTILRSEGSDGARMELKMVGRETLAGRATEKWQLTVEHAGSEPTHSFQWYDPQLGVAVREELPGGYVREMSDIRIGKQPDSLFEIPQDYRDISSDVGGSRAVRDGEP